MGKNYAKSCFYTNQQGVRCTKSLFSLKLFVSSEFICLPCRSKRQTTIKQTKAGVVTLKLEMLVFQVAEQQQQQSSSERRNLFMPPALLAEGRRGTVCSGLAHTFMMVPEKRSAEHFKWRGSKRAALWRRAGSVMIR